MSIRVCASLKTIIALLALVGTTASLVAQTWARLAGAIRAAYAEASAISIGDGKLLSNTDLV